MKVHYSEQVVTIDIDDTLVIWPENQPGNLNSHTQPFEGSQPFLDPYDGSTNHLIPYQKHIDLIKKFKGRGYFIIVWSAGGVKWAESVVKGLKLQPFVDLVMTKPCKYVDDLSCENWMGPRIYLK